MQDAFAHADPCHRVWLARRCALLILGIAVVDLGVVVVAHALGWSAASTVPLADDLFADYFKFVLSFPGGDAVHPSTLAGLQARLMGYQGSPDYQGIDGLARGHLTNLHVTPVTALFCLVEARAMGWVDPVVLFAAQVLGLAGWWTALVRRHAAGGREAVFWAIAGIGCYPAAMVVLRGNLYAGAAGLLIIQAMLSAVRRPGSRQGAVLLALACCIRPNAVLFVLPLLALTRSGLIRTSIWFGATGAGVSLVALWGAHALYPDYTLTSFRAALGVYYDIYVVHDAGVAYGSSAFGALKQMVGFRPGLDMLALVPAVLILLATAALAWQRMGWRTIRPSSLLFLTAAAYALGSTIFGDYHLLVFLVPPILLADERGGMDARARAITVASCLVLAPKNLIFPDHLSWQAVANPLILIAGSLQVLVEEWQAGRTVSVSGSATVSGSLLTAG